MDKLEVDPNLFITCRLCLDEKGKYQILPKVADHIKFCFDIEVNVYDGLPQLICKTCEVTLSQFVVTKQMFQEKQKSLRSRILNREVQPQTEEIKAQQEAVSSTQQADVGDHETVNTLEVDTEQKTYEGGESNVSNELDTLPVQENKIKEHSKVTTEETQDDINICENGRNKCDGKLKISRCKAWRTSYVKSFVCRLCSKRYKEKRSVIKHLQKHENIFRKYSSILNHSCFIELKRIDRKLNITKSKKLMMLSQDKIIQNKKCNYYIIYTPNMNLNLKRSISVASRELSMSDEEQITNKKCKRQRLLSRSSSETVVIERVEAKKDNATDDCCTAGEINDDEVYNLDSDALSVKSESELTRSELLSDVSIRNDKSDVTINNIIEMCYNKFLSKLLKSDGPNIKGKQGKESQLQHKLLSMGQKLINNVPFNCTGFLRYMEYNNLDVVFTPKLCERTNDLNYVRIQTKLRGKKNTELSLNSWKNLYNTLDIDTVPDFSDTLSKALTSGGSIAEDCEATNMSEKDTSNSFKLLNANPVANPKQLPRKNNEQSSTNSQKLFTNTNEHLNTGIPVITSTVSLADNAMLIDNILSTDTINILTEPIPTSSTNDTVEAKNRPRIKVKPVSELMPNNSSKNTSGNFSGFTTNSSWDTHPRNDLNISYLHSQLPHSSTAIISRNQGTPTYVNIAPAIREKVPLQPVHVYSCTTNNIPSCTDIPEIREEYLTLHSNVLPHERTKSPIDYFQRLLRMHGIILLHSKSDLPVQSKCLIKFKLGFQQENAVPVTLCLSLHSNVKTFCIKVSDSEFIEIDMFKMTPKWQWEILKVFKGDIVSKLIENSRREGDKIYQATSNFIALLNSIHCENVSN